LQQKENGILVFKSFVSEALLGAFVILDLSATANIYGFFFINEIYPNFLILPLGLAIMFVLYCVYFRLHDNQTLPDTFASSISSLVSALPLLQSEFNSVTKPLMNLSNFAFC